MTQEVLERIMHGLRIEIVQRICVWFDSTTNIQVHLSPAPC